MAQKDKKLNSVVSYLKKGKQKREEQKNLAVGSNGDFP